MKNQIFKNDEFGQIRTCVMDGETYFVGKDVASALGYKNSMDALMRHVDEEDKQTSGFTMGGQKYTMTVINESGLYALILSSKLESAKRFKHWVTCEVLPSIRKQGGYLMLKQGETDEQLMARAMQLVKTTLDTRNQQIALLLPKAEYAEQVLTSMSCLTVTQIAKEMGMVAHELNTLLCELGIQYKQSGQYLLYAPYVRKGLAQNRTIEFYLNDGTLFTYTYLVWTERGRYFIHKLLKRIAA